MFNINFYIKSFKSGFFCLFFSLDTVCLGAENFPGQNTTFTYIHVLIVFQFQKDVLLKSAKVILINATRRELFFLFSVFCFWLISLDAATVIHVHSVPVRKWSWISLSFYNTGSHFVSAVTYKLWQATSQEGPQMTVAVLVTNVYTVGLLPPYLTNEYGLVP